MSNYPMFNLRVELYCWFPPEDPEGEVLPEPPELSEPLELFELPELPEPDELLWSLVAFDCPEFWFS